MKVSKNNENPTSKFTPPPLFSFSFCFYLTKRKWFFIIFEMHVWAEFFSHFLEIWVGIVERYIYIYNKFGYLVALVSVDFLGKIRKMSINTKGILWRIVRFSGSCCYKFVRKYPVVSGFLIFVFFLYICFPSVFYFLMYSSPVLVCAAVSIRFYVKTKYPEFQWIDHNTTF